MEPLIESSRAAFEFKTASIQGVRVNEVDIYGCAGEQAGGDSGQDFRKHTLGPA